jgi:hypothetical protein
MKYIVIYREHNKMHLDTLHIGPFNTHDEAYDALCDMPALGQFNETDENIEGETLSGVKYVEPIYETFKEAFHAREFPMTEEEIDSLQPNPQ